MSFEYIEPVYRPPSEARSLILQVTNGCSWNKCTFCDMYTAPQKRFNHKPLQQVEQELQEISRSGYPFRRIFLADGDAMTLSVRRLAGILGLIRKYLPDVQRVSSYCLPRNLKNKTAEELAELNKLGLSLLYVGCESGDDLMLEKISKGETFASSLDALQKIRLSGMKSSVMIINGLGGKKFAEQHALNSARLMNESQPDYLATLVIRLYGNEQRYQEGFGGEFEFPDKMDLFHEEEMLLANLELDSTIFRSDHASNYLVLKGVLNRDKERLLKQVRLAIAQPGVIPLREEWQRGL
jgi:radical SAM superfamily enzyme YgiQ (UPF0313 family)